MTLIFRFCYFFKTIIQKFLPTPWSVSPQTNPKSPQHTYIKTMVLLLGLLIPFATPAQIAPVSAQLQIKAPYSVFLNEYTSPTSDRLKLNLVLLDLTKGDLEIGLRFILEAPGIRIATDPNYRGTPFYLDGGQNLVLEGYQLAEFFEPDHLMVSS